MVLFVPWGVILRGFAGRSLALATLTGPQTSTGAAACPGLGRRSLMRSENRAQCVGGPGHDDAAGRVCCSETLETMLHTKDPAPRWDIGTDAVTANLHAAQSDGEPLRYFFTLEAGDDGIIARFTRQELEHYATPHPSC